MINQIGGKAPLKSCDSIIAKIAQKTKSAAVSGYECEWLVPHFILKQTLVMVYAAPGSGKSLFAMHLAKMLLDSGKIGSAIYFDGDNGMATMKQRDLPFFTDDARFSHYFLTQNFKLFAELASANDLKNSLIIIDSIRNFMDAGPQDEIAVNRHMSVLCALRDSGATVIFLHHQPKQLPGENNRLYKGATGFLDGCDEAYFLSQPERCERGKMLLALEPQKHRDDTREVAFWLDLKRHEMSVTNYLFIGLGERAKITISLVRQVISEHAGINQNELAKELFFKAAKQYDIVGKNTLWGLLERFDGQLWRIEREPQKSGIAHKKFYPI